MSENSCRKFVSKFEMAKVTTKYFKDWNQEKLISVMDTIVTLLINSFWREAKQNETFTRNSAP